MIDARSMGILVDRTRRELTDGDAEKISACYKAWKGAEGAHTYRDVPGFCRSVTTAEIGRHKGALVPGRFVGFDHTPLSGRRLDHLQSEFSEIRSTLSSLSSELQDSIDRVERAFNG